MKSTIDHHEKENYRLIDAAKNHTRITLEYYFGVDHFMHRQDRDDGASQRAAKLSILLTSFEDYVNEIVKSNYGRKQEYMIKIAQGTFQRSMKANVDYHDQMAIVNQEANDTASENFHRLVAGIYESFLR